MAFPEKYKVLSRQVFSKDGYKIVPVRFEDRTAIMEWRNGQIYHLRQSKPLTAQEQDQYFSTVVASLFEKEQPGQLLFSYLHNDTCIGYGGLVHINWIDQNAEISFVLDTSLEKCAFREHWGRYLDLIEQVAFEELKFHKIFTYAFDLRPHLYEAIEAKGYKKEAVLPEHCYFDGRYLDVVIHGKIAGRFYLRPATADDSVLFFNWANDSQVRNNAFSKDAIAWEDHMSWFSGKLKNPSSRLFVFMEHQTPLGQLRLDRDGDYWVIDYSVDAAYRGKGLGQQMITLLAGTGMRPLKGIVKTSNPGSLRVFQKCAFSVTEEMLHGEAVYSCILN